MVITNGEILLIFLVALGDYVDMGLEYMSNYSRAEPDINIKKWFKRIYKRSMKSTKKLKAIKKAEKELKYRYGYLFLLQDYSESKEA